MSQSQLIRQPTAQQSADNPLSRWNKPTVTSLEADLAYFTARLEFIGIPATINQKVQVAVFRSLIQSTTNVLNRLR